MNRRNFITRGVTASVAASSAARAFASSTPAAARAEIRPMDSRPNILYVIFEDCGADFACYGEPVVRTPVLDKFASEAVRFSRAYSTNPVCSASRSALMTGCYQTAIGTHNHRTWLWARQPLPPPVRHICDWFREAGYHTCNLWPADRPRSPGPDPRQRLNGPLGAGKLDLGFVVDTPRAGDPFDGYDWTQRAPGQPFFAHITIVETHKGGGWQVARERPKGQLVDPDAVKLPPYYPDHPVARDEYANYLDAVNLVDGYVGQLLERLKREGLDRNTIVVLSSDHGQCLFRSKQFLYDGGLHIPLMVRFPDGRRAGTVDDRLVSGVDLAPTMLGFAGIRPPAGAVHGFDLFAPDSPRRDAVFAARDRMDMSIDRMRAVRTARYKYIRNDLPAVPYMQHNAYKERQYPTWNLVKRLAAEGTLSREAGLFASAVKPLEELFDLEADPHEVNNLARDPAHAAVLKDLRQRVVEWCRSYDKATRYESSVENHRGYWGHYPEDPVTPRPNYGR